MAEVLGLVDHADGEVKKVTLELLTLARRLGEPSAVVVGAGAYAALDRLREYGAGKVYVVDGDGSQGFADFVVAPRAEALAAVAVQSSPAAVLVASTPE